MKLRILHKGLILLLFPLLLQVAFFIQLFGLVNNSEALAQKETRFGKFNELANDMLLLLVKAWVGSTAYYMVETMGRPNKSIKSIEQINAIYPQDVQDRISELVSEAKKVEPEGPQGEKLLNWVQDATHDQVILLKRFRALSGVSKLEEIMLFKELEPKLLNAYVNTFAIEDMRNEHSKDLEAARERTTASRELIKREVLAGMAVTVLLAVALLVFFVINITSRLSLLMQNAKFVSLAKPLPFKVSGNDEIAFLDNILHQATEDLQKAAEHRQSITQMLAHDLRAPLTSIKITLGQLLRPEVRESQKTHDEYVTGMSKSVTRLIALIEDLLTIEKLESGKLDLALDYIELRPAVQEAIESLESQAAAKKIVCNNEVDSLKVVADQARIVQVVTNLLSNAIKFSPERGTITIYSAIDAKLIKVLVRDQGPGIPKAKQDDLFERYFQADSADQKQGFGLGLAICKMIVTRHGGTIGVTSQPGQGSTFWFSLPLDVPDEDV